MSDEALKRRLTDFICEVPFPRFVQSQGSIKIVADDLATWLAVFISYETKPLTAVADAARGLPRPMGDWDPAWVALWKALAALEGDDRG